MTRMSSMQPDPPVEPWVKRLKQAVDAGYYRTEVATEEQTPFPWQDRTCGDCPFFQNNLCQVRGARRGAYDATCKYFDAWHWPEAESIIQYSKSMPLHSDEAA